MGRRGPTARRVSGASYDPSAQIRRPPPRAADGCGWLAAGRAATPADMGKIMGLLKGKLAGRTDLSAVSGLVKARLAG